MRASKVILLASSNRGKFEEFKELFSSYPEVEIVPLSKVIRNTEKLGFVEKYQTYQENALAKARLANSAAHYPCLSDDSGLEIEQLGGKPGIKSRRYAIPKAGVSQDQANIEKVLEELKGVPIEKRKARFICALSLVIEGICISTLGTLNGVVSESPKGKGGFGYDSVFIPEGSTYTLAEMDRDEKNTISHRTRALHLLMEEVKLKGITLAKP